MKGYMIFGLVIAALLLLLWKWRKVEDYSEQTTDKGNIIVYGSKACGWCQKQEAYLKEKGIPYQFVDCREGGCPDGINAFPTLSINGQMQPAGYKEL
jgi:glutaredoxin